MEDAEPTPPAPAPDATLRKEPDVVVPAQAKNPRAQKLAAALRDNLRRRKAAGKSNPTARQSN